MGQLALIASFFFPVTDYRNGLLFMRPKFDLEKRSTIKNHVATKETL
jgi:hypothetical protein